MLEVKNELLEEVDIIDEYITINISEYSMSISI